MNRNLVILLHGVGSRGADMASLGEAWRTVLSNTEFASPDAPFPFDQGGSGQQWFSISGVTEANRFDRILAARKSFDQTIAGITDRHGLSDRLERVAFVGFSQGSIMSLDALASGRWPVAAVAAFSGRLVSPKPIEASKGTKVLLVHGDADQIIPARESISAEAALKTAGVDVDLHILPGLGHTISQQGFSTAGTFLSAVFDRT